MLNGGIFLQIITQPIYYLAVQHLQKLKLQKLGDTDPSFLRIMNLIGQIVTTKSSIALFRPFTQTFKRNRNPIYQNLFHDSKLSKLLRVASYCFRILKRCRRTSIHITSDEADETLLRLIRVIQEIDFSEEINILKTGNYIKKERLTSLNPYLDDNVILRVGGRLRNTSFSIDKKCPIVLSSKNHLTILIFEQEHLNLLHGGPQLLLSNIRERFWTLGGRNLARKVVHKCISV